MIDYRYYMKTDCTAEQAKALLKTTIKPIKFMMEWSTKLAYEITLTNKQATAVFDKSELNKVVEYEDHVIFVKTTYDHRRFYDAAKKYGMEVI